MNIKYLLNCLIISIIGLFGTQIYSAAKIVVEPIYSKQKPKLDIKSKEEKKEKELKLTQEELNKALLNAISKCEIEEMNKYLFQGADIWATTKDGETAIMVAVRTGKLQIVNCLINYILDKKIDILTYFNQQNSDGDTVYMIAAREFIPTIIVSLLSNLDHDKISFLPISWPIVENRSGETYDYIFAKNVSKNYWEQKLKYENKQDLLRTLERLLENRLKLFGESRSPQIYEAIQASIYGIENAIIKLKKNKAVEPGKIAADQKSEFDIKNLYDANQLLYDSLYKLDFGSVKYAIENGADTNATFGYYTPLTWLIKNGHNELTVEDIKVVVEITQYLIENGADVNLKNKNHDYPLEVALNYQFYFNPTTNEKSLDFSVANLLISNGSDVGFTLDEAKPVVGFIVFEQDNFDIIKNALNHANSSLIDDALAYVVKQSDLCDEDDPSLSLHREKIDILIQHGANIYDSEGKFRFEGISKSDLKKIITDCYNNYKTKSLEIIHDGLMGYRSTFLDNCNCFVPGLIKIIHEYFFSDKQIKADVEVKEEIEQDMQENDNNPDEEDEQNVIPTDEIAEAAADNNHEEDNTIVDHENPGVAAEHDYEYEQIDENDNDNYLEDDNEISELLHNYQPLDSPPALLGMPGDSELITEGSPVTEEEI